MSTLRKVYTSPSPSSHPVFLNNIPLPVANVVKYLGLYVDRKHKLYKKKIGFIDCPNQDLYTFQSALLIMLYRN
jgi:hypothetical protein